VHVMGSRWKLSFEIERDILGKEPTQLPIASPSFSHREHLVNQLCPLKIPQVIQRLEPSFFHSHIYSLALDHKQ